MKKLMLLLMIVMCVSAAWAQTPPITNDLIIHLEADSIIGLSDGDQVTSWNDQATDDSIDGSLSQINAFPLPTYQSNIINGHSVVRFADNVIGSSQFDWLDVNAGVTVLMVLTGDSSGQTGERAMGIGHATGASDQIVAFDASTNTDGADGGCGMRYNGGKALVRDNNPLDTNFHIAIFHVIQGDTYENAFFSVDDLTPEVFGVIANGTKLISLPETNNVLTVGTSWINGGMGTSDYYTGDMPEMLVYNRVLTDEELDAVGYYLSTKYDLATGFAPIMWAVSPYDGQVDANKTTDLTWGVNPEVNPTSMDLYFSSSFEQVDPNNTTNNMAPISIPVPADLSEVVYDLPELDILTTYYWRVDITGINPTSGLTETMTGTLKSFTTNSGGPVINEQPVPVTIAPSTSATFTVSVSNATSYAWYKEGNATPLSGNKYEGAATETLIVKDAQVTDEGYYYCIASNQYEQETTQSARLMTERIVAQWNFDNNLSDTVIDFIPDAIVHDANMSNPDYVDGIDGMALELLDDGRSCQVPDSVDYFNFYPQGFTTSFWIKSDRFAQWGMIVSKHDTTAGWFVATDTAGTVDFGFRNPGVTHLTNSTALTDGQWHQVVVQFDPIDTMYRLYVDGVIIDEIMGNPLPLTTMPVTIGANNNVANEGITASLDDFRIYNYALSALDVARLYTAATNGSVCIEKPEFDFNDDCKQNLDDFALFAAKWMECNIVPDCIE